MGNPLQMFVKFFPHVVTEASEAVRVMPMALSLFPRGQKLGSALGKGLPFVSGLPDSRCPLSDLRDTPTP